MNGYERPRKKHPVTLVLANQSEPVEGFLVTNMDEQLVSHLNGQTLFVEVEDALGRKTFINKTMIQTAEISTGEIKSTATGGVKLTGELDPRFLSTDPYVVLGAKRDMEDDEIKNLYHKLAHQYHRDRLQGLGLPPEMMAHADEVLKRVNSAFDAVQKERRLQAELDAQNPRRFGR